MGGDGVGQWQRGNGAASTAIAVAGVSIKMTELATAAAKVTLRLPLLPLAEVVVSVGEHRPTEATVAMVVMEMTVAGRCRGDSGD